MKSDERLVDLAYFDQLGLDDDSLKIEMIRLFIDRVPLVIDLLKRHNVNREWEKLSAEAHKFKPNLSYMGLDGAEKIIRHIEESANKNLQPEGYTSEINRLEKICRQAIVELKEELKILSNGT